MKKNKGVILLLAVGTAAILSLLGGVFYNLSFHNKQMSERQRQMGQAMQNAEAGIEQALFELREDYVHPAISPPDWTDGWINGRAFGPPFITKAPLNEGVYDVDLINISNRPRDIRIRSTGTVGNVGQIIEAYVSIKDFCVYNNAVFAGGAQDDKAIDGNAQIHGSVHLLGQGLAAEQYALSLGGGAYLSNNYEIPQSQQQIQQPPAFLDSLPSIINDVNLATLNAELRVRRGMVGLGGTSTVGEPDPKIGVKGFFDGTYVTDGFDDNTAAVYSDNGWENGYDLGDNLPDPSLNDQHEGYENYYEFYKAKALILKVNSEGKVILEHGTALPLTNDRDNDRDKGRYNSIQMDDKGNLIVAGLIYIDGDLDIGKNGGAFEDFHYTGRGAILVTGVVNVYDNLLANDGFPKANLIGLMAGDDMNLGLDSQIDIMGLFYSEKKITISNQTNIAGTVVGHNFNMLNVPGIYQVPATLDNLIPHMPGTEPFWVIKVVSWHRE